MNTSTKRVLEIESLRRRYAQARRERKRLTMTACYLRLRHLIKKQLQYENRGHQ